MNMKFSKKSKIACIGLMFVLILSVISLSLVQGEKPADPGTPPSGILSEIVETVDLLEAELIILQNELGDVKTILGNDVNTLQAQIDDVRSDIVGLGDGLHLVNTEAIPGLWYDIDTNIHPRINDLQVQIAEIYNEINRLRSEDLMEIWNHLDDVRSDIVGLGDGLHLVNTEAIPGIWYDIDTNIHPRIDDLQVQIAEIYNQLNFIDDDIRGDIALLANGIDELWIHVNNVDDNLQNQIDDLNTRIPQQGVISIPAAAFTTGNRGDNYPYGNGGFVLTNEDQAGNNFVAPVFLPDGVEVLRLTMYARHEDDVNDAVMCGLQKVSLFSDYTASELMAFVDSSNIGGNGAFTDDTITSPHIDYSLYYYYLNVHLPRASRTAFYYVTIEYEYPT